MNVNLELDRCVCGGPSLDPNPDCERCKLVGEIQNLQGRLLCVEGIRDGITNIINDPRLNSQSRELMTRVAFWLSQVVDRAAG